MAENSRERAETDPELESVQISGEIAESLARKPRPVRPVDRKV
jgi:hypothetical protein